MVSYALNDNVMHMFAAFPSYSIPYQSNSQFDLRRTPNKNDATAYYYDTLHISPMGYSVTAPEIAMALEEYAASEGKGGEGSATSGQDETSGTPVETSAEPETTAAPGAEVSSGTDTGNGTDTTAESKGCSGFSSCCFITAVVPLLYICFRKKAFIEKSSE